MCDGMNMGVSWIILLSENGPDSLQQVGDILTELHIRSHHTDMCVQHVRETDSQRNSFPPPLLTKAAFI